MTHGDQVMSVVLNRGAPTTVDGFESNDIVRFGDSSMFDGTLSVGAHSVTVIELDADIVVAPIYGCIDSTATNFDASATEDDGSCEYPPEPIFGCTDSTANNYNPEATEDDNSCTYPPVPMMGCTDETATNYNGQATQDDGSCTFDEPSNENSTNDSSINERVVMYLDGYIMIEDEPVWLSGAIVFLAPEANNLTLGRNYTMAYTLSNGTLTMLQDDVSWTATNTSMMDDIRLNGLDEGTYVFQAVLYSADDGQKLAENITNIQVGYEDNTSNNSENNESAMQTCDLCCGETYEHPADQPCPVAACAPCETTETSDSKSSAITLTRTLLVGGIIVVALILGLSGRNKRLQGDESFEIDLDDQEN